MWLGHNDWKVARSAVDFSAVALWTVPVVVVTVAVVVVVVVTVAIALSHFTTKEASLRQLNTWTALS